MNKKNSYLQIILTNISLLLILVLLVEVFAGSWLASDGFSYHMRGKRLQKIHFKAVINGEYKSWNYRRDYYGFREEFEHDNLYDLSKVKIIFSGGSTGDENLLPYNETIVGNLNSSFKKNNLNVKIFNGSLSGKSLQGSIRDFDIWFDKLKNLDPKVLILYVGLNDIFMIPQQPWSDHNVDETFFLKIYGQINQKSYFFNILRKFKNTYFVSEDTWSHRNNDKNVKKQFLKSNFLSYEDAKKTYNTPSNEEQKIIDIFNEKLILLDSLAKKKKIVPIFITQVNFEGNSDKTLFFLNQQTKKFTNKYNHPIIKLDELIDENLVTGLFTDTVHTNKEGSSYLANLIYPELKNILIKYNFYKKK